MKKSALWITLILVFTACSSAAAPAVEITPSQPAVQAGQTAAATPISTEAASPAACIGDAAPQEIDFTASDGQTLSGYFYPACSSGAPVVVLMHWIQGDETDWSEIAVWLQNRGQENPFQNPGSEDWWDPSWFPKVDPSVSYNVFIFSFRGCEHYKTGCRVRNNAGWLLDAQAAMKKAGQLAGVDPPASPPSAPASGRTAQRIAACG
jgi:predicted alpha/beta-fold hydrolase